MSAYLVYGLVISFLALAVLAICPKHSKVALISGILATPFGLLDSLFVLDYWTPPHIFGPLFSIEGMLFSFGNGVFVWLIAVFPFRRRLKNRLQFKILARRFVLYSFIALAVMLALWERGLGLANASLMTGTILGLSVIGVLMLSRDSSLLPLALTGALGFGMFYAVQLALLSLISPSFSSVWTAAVRDGVTVFGYPVEEMIWAVVYGCVWTTGIAYGCSVHILGTKNEADSRH